MDEELDHGVPSGTDAVNPTLHSNSIVLFYVATECGKPLRSTLDTSTRYNP